MGEQTVLRSEQRGLRVETTFPANHADPLLPLQTAYHISFQQTRNPGYLRNHSEWLIYFETPYGPLEWTYKDTFRTWSCLSSKFQFEIFGANGQKVVYGSTDKVLFSTGKKHRLVVYDSSNQQLGAISNKTGDRTLQVENSCGEPLIQICDTPKWFSEKRKFTFAWNALNNQKKHSETVATGERKIFSNQVLRSRLICTIDFVREDLDPIHKVLCLCGILFSQELLMRRNRVNGNHIK